MSAPLVLLVDRDRDTRTILRAAFEHSGYRVVDAATGEEALRLAREHVPEVVVGDFPLRLPGGSFFTTALRSDDRFVSTPMVAVTARALSSELEAARSLTDEVLLKPVRPRVVVAAVGRLLGNDPG